MILRNNSQASDCRTIGAGAELTPCTDATDCGADLMCVTDPTNKTVCVQMCRLGVPSDCLGGRTCHAELTPSPVLGGVTIGICL